MVSIKDLVIYIQNNYLQGFFSQEGFLLVNKRIRKVKQNK